MLFILATPTFLIALTLFLNLALKWCGLEAISYVRYMYRIRLFNNRIPWTVLDSHQEHQSHISHLHHPLNEVPVTKTIPTYKKLNQFTFKLCFFYLERVNTDNFLPNTVSQLLILAHSPFTAMFPHPKKNQIHHHHHLSTN